MARKGNQQKNMMEQHLPNHKRGISVSGPTHLTTEDGNNVDERKVESVEELPNDSHTPSKKITNDTYHAHNEKKIKKKSKKSEKNEIKVSVETVTDQADSGNDNTQVGKTDTKTADTSKIRDGSDHNSNQSLNSNNTTNSFGNLPNREDGVGNVEFPETAIFRFIRTAALSVEKAFAEWVERQTPNFVSLKASTLKTRDHVRVKMQRAKPIVFKWLMHIGNKTLLLFMVWLDCTLRGIDSFMRMGTTSFFSIVWCSVFSVIAMVGITKFLIILAVAAAVGLFLGLALGLILIGISGAILLWFYGSFWTTGFIILLSGLAFVLSHDQVALFIMSVYSTYCAWSYVGWLGFVLGLNLSFISSDVLLFFLRNVINDQRSSNTLPEQADGMHGQPFFSHSESVHATSSTEAGAAGTGAPAPGDRNPGVPSISGYESEMTSEDEVVRLLNCSDHYAAFGFPRFGVIDVSVIKREYRKKAMLVHPDKNMGNEKAVEAFKKLQNAYEVLLDSFKCKEYDDELRREELLNYFRKFNNAPHELHRESDREDPVGESRRIACKKCGFLHVWFLTKKLKSRARWCQECKDFHQAKDGDGWVEQSSQPFFFGILQKVQAPSAYVCADGKVYDATEWYICQGMRCSANSHRPSFHVNTSMVSKNNHTKGSSSSGQRGGIPTPNMEETMTEEEFFEWLQNAMQSGAFENVGRSSSESPTPTGFNPKNSNNDNGSNSSSTSKKRKKKGKKQW